MERSEPHLVCVYWHISHHPLPTDHISGFSFDVSNARKNEVPERVADRSAHAVFFTLQFERTTVIRQENFIVFFLGYSTKRIMGDSC